MTALTARQSAVLEIIIRSVTERGYPPTLREIGAAMHIRSTNGVNDHLSALERKGYIQRDDQTARSIRVLSKPIAGAPSQIDGRTKLESEHLASLRAIRAQLARESHSTDIAIHAEEQRLRLVQLGTIQRAGGGT